MKTDARPIWGTFDDDGLWLTDERLATARNNWKESDSASFDRTGKRTWVERETGREFRQIRGTPFAGLGASSGDEVDLFFVDAGRFVFLSGSEERVTSVHLGRMRAEQ